MGGRRTQAKLRSAVAASVALSMIAGAGASPWGREPGEVFLLSRIDYFTASAEPTEEGAIGRVRFERVDSNLYADVGVGLGLTLGGKAVYGTSTFFDGFETFVLDGFSEIEGFAQARLINRGGHAVSVRVAGAAPRQVETGVRPGLQSDGWDIEARLLYGHSILSEPVNIYIGVEGGYRRRFGEAADQVRADLSLGVDPTKRLTGLFEVFSVKSVGNALDDGADFDVVKVQPSLVWRVSRRWSLQAGVTHEAWGRRHLLGNTFFFGLWTEF